MRSASRVATEGIELAAQCFERVAPLLAGRGPEVQAAALADLVARWLAGHQVSDEQREEMLAEFIAIVRELVPVNEAEIAEIVGRQ